MKLFDRLQAAVEKPQPQPQPQPESVPVAVPVAAAAPEPVVSAPTVEAPPVKQSPELVEVAKVVRRLAAEEPSPTLVEAAKVVETAVTTKSAAEETRRAILAAVETTSKGQVDVLNGVRELAVRLEAVEKRQAQLAGMVGEILDAVRAKRTAAAAAQRHIVGGSGPTDPVRSAPVMPSTAKPTVLTQLNGRPLPTAVELVEAAPDLSWFVLARPSTPLLRTALTTEGYEFDGAKWVRKAE